MSDYSAVNPPTEKNQSQAFAAALQRAKEVRKHNGKRARRYYGWLDNISMRNTAARCAIGQSAAFMLVETCRAH